MITRDSLLDIAAFAAGRGRIISLVGAGGKTTLMLALANCFAACGERCIVTTTTHILPPERLPLAENADLLQNFLSKCSPVVYARHGQNGKLQAPSDLDLSRLAAQNCRVLVEADGSRQLPCKVPADHEPALPKETDTVLAVVGFSCLGKPIEQVCLRVPEVEKLLSKQGAQILEPADLAKILSSPAGLRKNVGGRAYGAVLNQCDGSEQLEAAHTIKGLLQEAGIHNVFCTSLHPTNERIN